MIVMSFSAGQIKQRQLYDKTYGLVVKRLRRRPLTAQSRVRFPARSPDKLKANPFPLGDGFAFLVCLGEYES